MPVWGECPIGDILWFIRVTLAVFPPLGPHVVRHPSNPHGPLAPLRVTANPEGDVLALEQVINTPARGLGEGER